MSYCNLALSQSSFNPDHQYFIACASSVSERSFYHQAVKDPLWIEAMNKELLALESNKTWSLIHLPPGKKPVGCKWVYTIKTLANDQIDKYKVRLVAKGYTQSEGIDFHHTFAPVVKVGSLLAIAAVKNWHVEQLDVNNAFLHRDLKEEVYMQLLLGYQVTDPTLVCRHIKSIYGLRQASRQWFSKLTSCLLDAGYQ